MDKISDVELIKLVQAGDKEAYRSLVERYQERVYGLAFEILKSREDAEDVAQESFVKAYLSITEFKGESSFYTWLYRIVYNMAIDFKRKIARRGGEKAEFDETVAYDADGILGRVEGPQEQILRQEQRHQIRAALDSISEEHRVVITLREVDGLSYEEIAKVTGISRGTVMSRLHYARKKVQSVLIHLSSGEAGGTGGNKGNTVRLSEDSEDRRRLTSEAKHNVYYGLRARAVSGAQKA